MRKKVISCVVAGALALSVPLAGSAAFAEQNELEALRQASAALEHTYLGNQVDALFARIDAGVSAEERAQIEEQIQRLLKLAEQEGLLGADGGTAALPGASDGSVQPGEGAAQTPAVGGEGDGAGTEGEGAEGEGGTANDPAATLTPEDPTSGVDPDEGAEGDDPSNDPAADPAPEDPAPGTDPAPEEGTEGEGPADDPAAEPAPGVDPSPAPEERPSVDQPAAEQPAVEQAPPASAPSTPSSATTLPLVPEANSFDSGEVPHYDYTENLTTEKFIAVIGEQARAIAQESDLYASVMIAQAILESGSGQSELSKAPNNNLFGIKGSWEDEKGQKHSVSFLTSEDNGSGALYQIVSDFRAYDTVADSLQDYADLLTKDMGAFYQGAWKKNAKTYEEAAKYLQGRYATDTSYAAKICGLIETYHLDRFDEALAWTPVDEDVDLTDLLAEATSHLGTAYVWGGASPLTGFDCSGLIQWSYKEALDIDLSRTTYTQCLEGELVSFDDLHPGDLLFFNNNGDVHHVALYLGDGFYIHAPQTGQPVQVTSMEEYAPSFAKRIVETRPVEEPPVVSKVLSGLKSVLFG